LNATDETVRNGAIYFLEEKMHYFELWLCSLIGQRLDKEIGIKKGERVLRVGVNRSELSKR
jgi:hypothetical protein